MNPIQTGLKTYVTHRAKPVLKPGSGVWQPGLYGDSAPVGEGVKELRMFFGSGYRVYFGEEAENIVVLLCGGDKSTQNQDIKIAKAYWKEYQTHD